MGAFSGGWICSCFCCEAAGAARTRRSTLIRFFAELQAAPGMRRAAFSSTVMPKPRFSFRAIWLRWLTAAVASAALACPAHAGPVLDRIQSTGMFKMGYRPDSAPFSWASSADSSTILGYSAEVCQHIARAIAGELKVQALQIVPVPVFQSTRIASIVRGDIDMECAGTTNTQERRGKVAFGLTYFYAGAALLVSRESGIANLGDLKDKTLGALEGTTSKLIAEMYAGRNGGWRIRNFHSLPEAAAALRANEIQAVMGDDVLLLAVAAQSGGQLAVPAQRDSVEPLAPMFSKDDAELEKMVRAIMQNMYRGGEMNAIYARWFLSPLPGLGYNLNLKMGALLQDSLRRPTDCVSDWTVM